MKALNLGADRYIKKEGNPKDQFKFLVHSIVREKNQHDIFIEKEEREKIIKKIYETSIELSTYDSEEEIYSHVLDSFESILEFQASSICMAKDGCLVVQATDAKNVEKGEEYPNDEGIIGLTYQNQESYLIDDLSRWEEAGPSDPDFKSVLSIPIKDEGVFQALSYEKDYFDEFELEMSELLITHMWEIVKDIRYQNEFEENRAWLSQIIENSSVPTFVIDEKHEVTHWNEACENLTDVSKETVIGTGDAWKGFYDERRPVMADLVLEDASEEEIREHYGDKFSESVLLEDAYEAEDFFSEFEEEGRWFYFTAAPIKDSEGNKIGAIETLQDVTEQKKAQKELEKERRLLNQAEEISDVGGWEYDVKNDEIYWTENLFELHGFTKGEKDGHGKRSLESYPEKDRKRVKEAFEKAVEEGIPYDLEVQFTDADGKEMWIETVGEPIIENGEVVKVVGTMVDITDTKEAEQELRKTRSRLLRSQKLAKVGSWEFNLETEELSLSDEIYSMFGISEEEEINYEKFLEYVHLEDREHIDKKWQEEMDEQYDLEYRIIVNGKTKWVRAKAELIYDDEDNPKKLVGSAQDITERKEKEKAIQEGKQNYEELFDKSADAHFVND
ncbi:MAG: PAS domain S-box protein, partial [Thermoplasmata archaeon]